jgi:hypothetical protein
LILVEEAFRVAVAIRDLIGKMPNAEIEKLIRGIPTTERIAGVERVMNGDPIEIHGSS